MNSIINEYRRILEEKGIRLSDCTILHFRFKGNRHHTFHFDLMERGLSGYLFDSYDDGNVYVVISKDDSRIDDIKQLAESMGSECDCTSSQ